MQLADKSHMSRAERRFTSRLMNAAENTVLPFPGAVRQPEDTGDYWTERRVWSILRELRRKKRAEARMRAIALSLVSATQRVINLVRSLFGR